MEFDKWILVIVSSGLKILKNQRFESVAGPAD